MKKIIVYGIGNNCEIFLNNVDMSQFDVVAFVDKYKHGQIYRNKPVLSIEEIKNITFDKIFVTNMYYDGVLKELIEKLKIDRNVIETSLDINIKYIFPKTDNCKYVAFLNNDDYLNFIYGNMNGKNNFVAITPLNVYDYCDYSQTVDKSEKIFIFATSWYFVTPSFFKYIKYRYPLSKFVMIFNDTIDGELGYCNTVPNFVNSFNFVKKEFDAIFTYHKGEAKKYDIEYLPQYYPTPIKDDYKNVLEEIDVIFVGYAKNRLNLLHNVFLKLSDFGLKCKFWIVGVDEDLQIHDEGLIYNQRLKYTDYLKEVLKSKCILEVVKEGNETSLRYTEAVVYHKKLLLNDPTFYEKKYAFKENMQFFTDADSIDLTWFDLPKRDYSYDGEYLPEKFIDSLKKHFNM